jgi:hypothetical protein
MAEKEISFVWLILNGAKADLMLSDCVAPLSPPLSLKCVCGVGHNAILAIFQGPRAPLRPRLLGPGSFALSSVPSA